MTFFPGGDGRMDMWDRLDDHDVPFLVGAVALGIVLGVVVSWLIASPSSDTSGGADQTRLSGEGPRVTPFVQPRTPPGQMERCTQAATALQLPLRRAAASIDQWEVHVGAMNKLVVGAITLRQANAFWNRTRVGARHRIAELDRAWARLQRHGMDCPSPAMLSSGARQALRSCAREVALDMRVLQTARSAIDTWRRHVRAMDMLRMGKMSPSTANQMWLAMWQRGQHEIDAYRAAAHAARSVAGCSLSPSASRAP